jgi:hypothetical protein
MMAGDPREPFQRRLSKLIQERQSWVSHWKELNEYILPRRGRFLGSALKTQAQPNRGEKINQKIIDSEATRSLGILVSGLMSGVTSPARKWFQLRTPDREMMEFGPVKEWLTSVEDSMYEIFAESNFYQVLPYVYEEMAVYGTGAMMQFNDYENVVRFQAFSTGEYCIAQDYTYSVNAIYREAQMTVEQVAKMYGLENCSQSIRDRYSKADYDGWVEIVHLVEPNDSEGGDFWGDDLKTMYGSNRAQDKPWRMVCYEKAGNDGKLLSVGGFDNFPIYCPRWHLEIPNVYGRSPGMNALGDIKQLQDQQKKKGQAIAKMVNPPMVADPAMKNQRMTTLPGDVTFADTSTAGGFKPAYQVQPRLNEFIMDMEDVRRRIQSAFFADVFLAISNMAGIQPRNEIELTERREEKLLVLGPVLQRLNHDLLDPLIDNMFDRMLAVGMVNQPPPELQGQPLRVEYISMMARAQKSQGILGLQDTAQFVGSLAAINPEVVDKFDFDQSVDEFGELRGVPTGVIRTDEEVAEARQARAQQQQQAMVAERAQQAAAGAKQLGETSTQEGNLLGDMIAGIGAP